MKKNIVLFTTFYLLIKIFLNYQVIQNDVYMICLVFFKKIFPSLFIFFIISSILINYGFVELISKIFGKLFRFLFNINNYQSYIFIMSMLSGLPSNAKYIKELLDSELIEENDANHILLFSHFANPLFILFMGLNKPYLIILAHYLPNIIIGLFIRGFKSSHKTNKINHVSKPFNKLLSDSITSSFNTLLMVLGLIIIFNIIGNLTNSFILKYILEMSSSVNYITTINISDKLKAMLVSGILSFGGICVHMQVMSILNNKKIRYTPYLLARLLHFCMSSLIIYLIY